MKHRTVGRCGLAPAIKRAGINDDPTKPRMTWHDMRRTCGSLLPRHGANLPYVSRFLGHANPNVTLRVYAKQLDALEQDEETKRILEASFVGKDMENGGGERARTDGAPDPAKVASLRASAGGGD